MKRECLKTRVHQLAARKKVYSKSKSKPRHTAAAEDSDAESLSIRDQSRLKDDARYKAVLKILHDVFSQ